MKEIVFAGVKVKAGVLHEQIKLAGVPVRGVSTGWQGVTVHISDEDWTPLAEEIVRGLVLNFDPEEKTAVEKELEIEREDIVNQRVWIGAAEDPDGFVDDDLTHRLAEHVYYLRMEVAWLRRFIDDGTKPP